MVISPPVLSLSWSPSESRAPPDVPTSNTKSPTDRWDGRPEKQLAQNLMQSSDYTASSRSVVSVPVHEPLEQVVAAAADGTFVGAAEPIAETQRHRKYSDLFVVATWLSARAMPSHSASLSEE